MDLPRFLVALPVLAFLLLFAQIYGRQAPPDRGWARAFVIASIGWGTYLTGTSEILSLLGGLSRLGVAIAWGIPVGLLLVLLARSGRSRVAWQDLGRWLAELTSLEKGVVTGILLVCGVLLGIALIAPPNNIDSDLYHMARVVHWAQDASLRPYPTIMEHQLHKPIWAETAILHMRILWGDDRPANLIQWFSMVGSMLVAGGIVSLLGGRRMARWLAAAFAATIPMGILQSTSTQNDYVAAFWAATLAYLVVLSMKRRLLGWELLALAASVGLSFLTKGTGFVYAPPFVAWFLLHELMRRGVRRALVGGLSIAGAVVLLNAGFWGRNIAVYGGPYGTADWLQRNLWIRFFEEPSTAVANPAVPTHPVSPPTQTPSLVVGTETPGEAPSESAEPSGAAAPPSFVSNYWIRLAQTLGRNLTFPTGFINRPLMVALASMPGVFGQRYAEEMQSVSWNNEDFAGSPLHLLFILGSCIVLLGLWPRPETRLALGFAGVVVVALCLNPIVIGHGPSMFGVRYQLSFFVLGSPVVGAALGFLARPRALGWLAIVFLIGSLPWILFNKSRPLVGMPPTRTVVGSILTEKQATILLAWSPRLRDDYGNAARAIQESGCRKVGLRAKSSFLEYPLWWLLDAPQSGIRIESLETTSYLEPFADKAFKPCAIVCADCGQEATVRGMPLYGAYDSIKVYLEE